VGKDQSLIADLTPDRMEGFNLDTPDRPDVRYGSVVTGAPPPSFKGLLQVVTGKQHPGLGDLVSFRTMDPEPQTLYGAWSFLYKKSAPGAEELRTPEPDETQARALRESFGEGFRSRSDGIVPTRSQVRGRVIAAVVADHLDVMGHFDEPPKYVGWLKSGSGFRSPQFQGLWDQVLDFMMGAV
jgi:triacylglycerol lipase